MRCSARPTGSCREGAGSDRAVRDRARRATRPDRSARRAVARIPPRRAGALPGPDPLRSARGGLVRAERVGGPSGPGLVAGVYRLIDRGGAAAYRRAVEGSRLDGLRVVVSGPGPAWSFAPELGP